MEYFPFVVVAWILAVGLYGIVTSRHLVHQIICLIVVQSSTYVLLLGVGVGGRAGRNRHRCWWCESVPSRHAGAEAGSLYPGQQHGSGHDG